MRTNRKLSGLLAALNPTTTGGDEWQRAIQATLNTVDIGDVLVSHEGRIVFYGNSRCSEQMNAPNFNRNG